MGLHYHPIILLSLIILILPMFIANFNPIVLDVTNDITMASNIGECSPRSRRFIFDYEPKVLFYETGCQRFQECIHQINTITSSILKACNFGRKLNQTIIFSIPITDSNAEYMCSDEWETLTPLNWLCGQIAVVISWEMYEPCDSLPNHLATCYPNLKYRLKQAIHPELRVGLGFGRKHLLCTNYQICFNEASFFAMTEQVGYGDADMYGLIAENLDSFQQNCNSSQKQETTKPNETCADQIPHILIHLDKVLQFSESCLHKYLQTLETSQNKQRVGLVLSPSAVNPTHPTNIGDYTSNLIGDLKKGSCFKIDVASCYGISTVQLLMELFSKLMLDYDQWESIQSLIRHASENYLIPKFPRALIDFTNGNVSVVQSELEKFLYNYKFSTSFTVTAIIVAFDEMNATQILSNNFFRKVSSKIQVFCSLYIPKAFPYYNKYSSVAHFAESNSLPCEKIGGSNYVLEVLVDIRDGLKMDFSNFFYETQILKQLTYSLQVRENLWMINPRLKPYIRILTMSMSSASDKMLKTTVFCNEKAFKLNELFMGIQAWANFHGFPIFLKNAVDHPANVDPTSWFTNLMPFFRDLSDDFVMKQYPVFVLRDFPDSVGGFVGEPCINWTQEPPKIGDDFFLNTSLGVTLSMHFHRKPETTTEEMQTILTLLMHKFQTVELLITNKNDSLLFQEAISKDFVSTTGKETNDTQIFVDYLVSNDDDDSLNILSTIMPTTVNKDSSSPSLNLGGIILNVLRIEPIFSYEFPTSQNITKIDYVNLLVDTASKLSSNVGIAFDSSDMLLPEIIRNESIIFSTLSKIQLIVCYRMILENELERDELAGEFDGFIYTQKVLARYYPNLTLVFRIYPLFDLHENTISPYVRFLLYLKQLGSQYNIKFFPVRAFDSGGMKNGWWTIDNFTDLTNVSVYNEKESVFSKRETWRPKIKRKETTKQVSKTTMLPSILISSLVFVLLVVCCLCILVLIRYKRMKLLLSDKEVKDILYGRLGRTEEGVNVEGQFGSEQLSMRMKFDFKYELSMSNIAIDTNKILGFGQFGTVFKGLAKGNPVAVKMPNEGCSATTLKTFLAEVNVLCYIGSHPNIVEFVGAYIREIRKGILQVATELCPNGSLESHMRRKEHVVTINEKNLFISNENSIFIYDMYRFCSEIAAGMQHIAEKHFIHGDLAARNVLLDSNFTCKICDFGFSRKLYNYETYLQVSQVPLPWRWAAYEVLSKREFSIKSDVWSFGITMWEIFTLGNLPYANFNLSAEFISELKEGLRPSQPEHASADIYSKLLECWDLKPEQRPKFNEIEIFFNNMCSCQYSTVNVV